jgi:hypothetical protein
MLLAWVKRQGNILARKRLVRITQPDADNSKLFKK